MSQTLCWPLDPIGANVEDKLWHQILPGRPAATQPEIHTRSPTPCDWHPPKRTSPSPPAALGHSGQLHRRGKKKYVVKVNRGTAIQDSPLSTDQSNSCRYSVRWSACHRVGPSCSPQHGKQAELIYSRTATRKQKKILLKIKRLNVCREKQLWRWKWRIELSRNVYLESTLTSMYHWGVKCLLKTYTNVFK